MLGLAVKLVYWVRTIIGKRSGVTTVEQTVMPGVFDVINCHRAMPKSATSPRNFS